LGFVGLDGGGWLELGRGDAIVGYDYDGAGLLLWGLKRLFLVFHLGERMNKNNKY